MLAISIAKLAVVAFAIPIIATPFKHNAYKAAKGYIANSITWFNYIKGILGKLVNLLKEKF